MGSDPRLATLPDIVVRRAESLGPVGEAWLAALPALIAAIEQDWRLTAGAAMGGGTEAFVAEATLANGEVAILKLALPSSSEAAARVLIAADGRGYARVLKHDLSRRALLLEKLGARLGDLGLSVTAQIEALCATLQRAWAPAPADLPLQTGAEKARDLAVFIDDLYAELKQPCSAEAVALCHRYAVERASAYDPAQAILAHGDAHAWNALAVPGSSEFKFVDPEGLFIERAYDLGVVMREWAEDLLAGDARALGRARAELLSRLGGAAPEAIWQWGMLERVASGLLLVKLGESEMGLPFLKAADAMARA